MLEEKIARLVANHRGVIGEPDTYDFKVAREILDLPAEGQVVFETVSGKPYFDEMENAEVYPSYSNSKQATIRDVLEGKAVRG